MNLTEEPTAEEVRERGIDWPLRTYGWHRSEVCERYLDDVPETGPQWRRVPKKCPCGFYEALRRTHELD